MPYKSRAIAITPLLLLASCASRIQYPEPPAVLDYNPHPAALGQEVTVTGPVNDAFSEGLSIYDNPGLTGAVYGHVLANRQAEVILNSKITMRSVFGDFGMVQPFANYCEDGEVYEDLPNVDWVNIGIAALYAPSKPLPPTFDKSGEAFPATVAQKLNNNEQSTIVTGYFIHSRSDATIISHLSCDTATQKTDLYVNLELKAGWNVLKRQDRSTGASFRNVISVVTGAAADYSIR
ncbi:hypothetical protein E7T09_04540 [Deinococcus sp. KSM4-11]|uniref:hypothetical protein n=1 Tax=Deinococcus sp. KSM4-11 TaxID=2568654 RepID=UPI0010A2A9D6|nr:hypothetical protein [Deinococcus sp. KSM4-11]THF88479.1 hypothetical protein E7T09_04540 [Deinococcus sp. KSM4-11]